MKTITLIYADGRQWIAGSVSDPDAWTTQAKLQSDWDPATQIQVTDNTPPAPTAAEITARAWTALRLVRDDLLADSDWTQLADAPIETDQKTAWAAYRQALRDLPETTTDPASPAWPTPPGGAQ